MSQPVRVFIGTEQKTEIARKVLEHSIRRQTSAEVEFVPMIGPEWEYDISGIPVGTGFSLRRWMIPAYCGFQGRAIYLDADTQAFADIEGLWRLPDLPRVEQVKAPVVWATFQTDKWSPKKPVPQTSVMVIDCRRAEAFSEFRIDLLLDDLRARPTKDHYGSVMHASWLPADRIAHVADKWNSLNKYEAGKTRILHYTKEDEQVWFRPDHPLSHLWQAELELTIKAGGITREEFEQALGRWGVKEDWRRSNGLNPFYRKYLPLFG